MSRALLPIFFCAFLMGCTATSKARTHVGNEHELDADRVLVIARTAVAANDAWVGYTEFGVPTRSADSAWSVLVKKSPARPGSHMLLRIDATGTIAEFVPGA